jgi:site-specific recombinase XerD
MFESLFTYPGVQERHQEAPFAVERAKYVAQLAERGMPRVTLQRRADYCRHVAIELERQPQRRRWCVDEVDTLARAWASARVVDGRAGSERWPYEHFRLVALEFVESLGRLVPVPAAVLARDEDRLNAFIAKQQEATWQSAATCGTARWQVREFLRYLEVQGVALESVRAAHVDAYFAHVAKRWSRVSLAVTAKMLRAWFRHGEAQGWSAPGLAEAVLAPRLYRHEGLPLGPNWDQVKHMLASITGDTALALRNRAMVLLLAVYGLRSAEVRHLRIDDIEWSRDQLQVTRAKSGRRDAFPLVTEVGNAIARYLCQGRPSSPSRAVFLTVHAPFRPLSAGALYHLVRHALLPVAAGRRQSLGPHALRHACARHLLESGHSLKAVGDHLGHRDPDTTRIYAKVNLAMLRLVVLEDLGGLL